MANIKSSKKRIETNNKKRLINKSNKSKLKTQTKKFVTLVDKNELDAAENLLATTFSTIDKTAAKGSIHKNAANRRKSKLAKKLSDLKSGKKVVEVAPVKGKKQPKAEVKSTEVVAAPEKVEVVETAKPAVKKTPAKSTAKTATKKPAAKKTTTK